MDVATEPSNDRALEQWNCQVTKQLIDPVTELRARDRAIERSSVREMKGAMTQLQAKTYHSNNIIMYGRVCSTQNVAVMHFQISEVYLAFDAAPATLQVLHTQA